MWCETVYLDSKLWDLETCLSDLRRDKTLNLMAVLKMPSDSSCHGSYAEQTQNGNMSGRLWPVTMRRLPIRESVTVAVASTSVDQSKASWYLCDLNLGCSSHRSLPITRFQLAFWKVSFSMIENVNHKICTKSGWLPLENLGILLESESHRTSTPGRGQSLQIAPHVHLQWIPDAVHVLDMSISLTALLLATQPSAVEACHGEHGMDVLGDCRAARCLCVQIWGRSDHV